MTRAHDIASPCSNVCALDPDTQLCRGCYRSAAEIAGWTEYSAEEKAEVLRRAGERRAAAMRAAT